MFIMSLKYLFDSLLNLGFIHKDILVVTRILPLIQWEQFVNGQ